MLTPALCDMDSSSGATGLQDVEQLQQSIQHLKATLIEHSKQLAGLRSVTLGSVASAKSLIFGLDRKLNTAAVLKLRELVNCEQARTAQSLDESRMVLLRDSMSRLESMLNGGVWDGSGPLLEVI